MNSVFIKVRNPRSQVVHWAEYDGASKPTTLCRRNLQWGAAAPTANVDCSNCKSNALFNWLETPQVDKELIP